MQIRTVEISVGAFMLAGILALAFLAVKVSGVSVSDDTGGYQVHARFDDVSGLSARARVTMAGVLVGRVAGIRVDPEYGEAVVTMQIQGGLPLTADTGARILTEGILGGKYVALEPGADDLLLADGDVIQNTQGSLVLENLIGDFITRAGSG